MSAFSIFALDFPPVSHLIEWPAGPLGFNKIAAIFVASTLLTILVFVLGSKQRLVPKGFQTVAEASVDFVENNIVMETIGPEGMKYMPFFMTMFFFIFFSNITEIIPIVQMPANARMAMPAMLALLVWVIYNVVGVANQGPIGYLKNSLFPPGVPKALYILVTPIELVSTFIVRPFSLAVRLFANMLAGHLLLVTFAVLCAALWSASALAIVLLVSFPVLVALTAFEILVAFLQAFIFTILTAVYIGGAMHPEH